MVRLEVDNKAIANEAAELIRAFFPRETVDIADTAQYDEYSFTVKSVWSDNTWSTSLNNGEKYIERKKEVPVINDEDEVLYKRRVKNALKETVYYSLKELTGRGLPYGMLTGVRPLTLSNRFLERNDASETERLLMSEYDVSKEKAHLLTQTSLVQARVKAKPEDVSMYIHIPFCTTRCNYCSFPSELVGRVEPLLDKYMDALEKEVEFIVNNAKGRFDSLYVGGGTPTSLPERHFERLIEICNGAVAARDIKEYMIEAGRPDTITTEKLKLMKSAGVNRISINPQTMNDKTLELIGRKHTSRDIEDMFYKARELGFDNINMDMILGLSGEDNCDIANTFDKVLAMEPEGITIHVLALKHASELNRQGVDIFGGMSGFEDTSRRHTELFAQKGYIPYYLYRQKYMLGGLENVGYCKPDNICIYNIRMMDDSSTCWAAGAGSISKRCYSGTTRIERAANPKQAADYINSIDDCIAKKAAIME